MYKAAAAASFHALKAINMQHRNKAIALGGKNGSILLPGMGVLYLLNCLLIQNYTHSSQMCLVQSLLY